MFLSFGELLVITATIALIGLILPFWAWMFVDCMNREPPRSNAKALWIIIIIIAGPLGAAMYFLARRRSKSVDLREFSKE